MAYIFFRKRDGEADFYVSNTGRVNGKNYKEVINLGEIPGIRRPGKRTPGEMSSNLKKYINRTKKKIEYHERKRYDNINKKIEFENALNKVKEISDEYERIPEKPDVNMIE